MAGNMPFGVATEAELAAQEPNILDKLVAGIINGTVTLPKRVIDATMATAPGLRREDFTDIPGSAQPGAEMREAALETGLMTMGGTAFGAPVARAGEAVLGAGPVRKAPALPMDEASRMARAAEQGFEGPWYHGGARMDRFTEAGKINPKRATSGPMPFFTDDPAIASNYTRKSDTSMADIEHVKDYFTVSPKDLGMSGRSPYTVEQSWHFLPAETKAEILEKAKRVGYENPAQASGPLKLHPPGADASISGSQFDRYLKEERGNPLAALRKLWVESGELVGSEAELANIYRLSGYKAPISEVNAPWTEAAGVFPARLRMTRPLQTDNVAEMTEKVLPALEQVFKRDRSQLKTGADQWAKESRWTPREWVEQAKADYAKGDNSFVWTSIPDKVTAELRRLGYDGILDSGGKMGGHGHRVAVPFGPEQVRSQFAKFDPANLFKPNLLGGIAGAAPVGALLSRYPADEGM
jgi:hypothetical protein